MARGRVQDGGPGRRGRKPSAGGVAKASAEESDTPKIAKRQGTSLNHQIYLVLHDRIQNGQYEGGQMLPSEDELASMFSVSRVTVRTAMAHLEAKDLIERRQGVGTFVSRNIRPVPLHAPVSDLIAHIADIDRKTDVRLIEFDYVKAPTHIQQMFQCGPDAIFQRAVRLRSMGRLPVFHVTTFLPQHIAKELSREEMNGTSLYRLLARGGIRLHSGKQVVSAQLADPIVAPLLDVTVGAPLLQVRRQHFDQHGKPVEYFEMLASPSVFELHMTIDADNLPT